MEKLRRLLAPGNAIAVGVAWALCAASSILFASNANGIAAVWPANAVLLVALLARPVRRWWPPALAAFLAAVAVNLAVGRHGANLIGFPIANVAEALVAAALLRRLGGGDALFERMSGTAMFVAACLAAGMVSALLSAGVMLLDTGRIGVGGLRWFASDTLGLLILTPLLQIGARLAGCGRAAMLGRRRPREVAAVLGLVLVASLAIFTQDRLPLLFLALPPVQVAAHRLRAFGAAAATLIIVVAGTLATAHGHGPLMLMQGSVAERIYFFQFYVAVTFLSALPMAALLAERDALAAVASASERRLREAAESAARHARGLAATDELTGLANRREFMRRLEQERALALEAGVPLALALLDIDHFKRVNDRHGHAAGDAVLRAVADSVRARVRDHDLVARLGGEEFAVLMPGATPDAARGLSERLRAAVEETRCEHGIGVTVSVGLAMLAPGRSADALLAAADDALYAAKADGRNVLRLAA